MRNILILIHVFIPYDNANTNCLLPIIEELKINNNVIILTCDLKRNQQKLEKYNGYIINRVKATFGMRLVGRFMPCFRKYFDFTKLMIAKMKSIIENNQIDSIITVSSPHYTHASALALSKNGFFKNNNVEWVAYYMDPVATYIGNTESERVALTQSENEVYMHADKVVITPEMYAENKKNFLKGYLFKTYPLYFANIKDNRKRCVNVDNACNLDKNRINLVYIGSLQDLSVRNPKYFLDLILKITNENFCIHLVGRYSGENGEMVNKYLSNENIKYYGLLPIETCFYLMENADIMINIGNICANQTPSKIFDYMSAGKPIVNFCSHENDTSKHYLSDYPCVLNILEQEQVSSEHITQFIDFCKQKKGVKIEFEKVEKLYNKHTAKAVSDEFAKIINKINIT